MLLLSPVFLYGAINAHHIARSFRSCVDLCFQVYSWMEPYEESPVFDSKDSPSRSCLEHAMLFQIMQPVCCMGHVQPTPLAMISKSAARSAGEFGTEVAYTAGPSAIVLSWYFVYTSTLMMPTAVSEIGWLRIGRAKSLANQGHRNCRYWGAPFTQFVSGLIQVLFDLLVCPQSPR